MTRKTLSTPLGHLAKPSALRHATRIDRDEAARHRKDRDAKPEFDPAESDRWIDRHGRFTIPHTKGERK
jgi:hypothetical protein